MHRNSLSIRQHDASRLVIRCAFGGAAGEDKKNEEILFIFPSLFFLFNFNDHLSQTKIQERQTYENNGETECSSIHRDSTDFSRFRNFSQRYDVPQRSWTADAFSHEAIHKATDQESRGGIGFLFGIESRIGRKVRIPTLNSNQSRPITRIWRA